MKKLLLSFVLLGLAFSRQASAQTLSYTAFHSDIQINTDASITVTETITVNFSDPHHGIFRNIPFRFTTLDGGSASIPLVLQSVRQDGQSAHFSSYTDGNDLVVKIGDPNKTISGSHVYGITYMAQAASNFFSDHDELYWNVTGTDWDEPMTNVSATVTLPSGVAADTDVQTACYTGPTGSTATDCTQEHTTSQATFSAHDYLTIVVGWPVGLITKPANFDTLRAAGTGSGSNNGDVSNFLVVLVIIMLVIAAPVIFLFFAKFKKKDRRAIIPQYDPPTDVRPAEAAKLIGVLEQGKKISAMIIDLCVRGFIRIEETEEKILLGLAHSKGRDLVEVKPGDSSLRKYEQKLLDAIFRQEDYPAQNGRIALSTFTKHRTSTYEAFEDVIDELNAYCEERGWYAPQPGWRSIFGNQPTQSGLDAAWQLKGFKLFLKTAEQYRIQWQERQGIFEQFLPYAMVFGVAKHWSETLAPMVTTPPNWYRGDFSNGYTSMMLYSSISSFSVQVSSSAVSGAASSSSGFSGGSSGGGGGGGGGGGW